METCQWIADRTAAPLQKGIIDSISVPLILNHYFIFYMALMRVIKKFEVSKLFPIQVQSPSIFYFTYQVVIMSVILIKRVNFIQNLKKHVSTDGIVRSVFRISASVLGAQNGSMYLEAFRAPFVFLWVGGLKQNPK